MLTAKQKILKRTFDLVLAVLGLFATGWLILVAFVAASIDTRDSGFFRQTRVGKNGKLFKTIKIRTMRNMPRINTTVTTMNDPRITRLGHFFRKTKVDELPQLLNVLFGQMSMVGPRPDVPGFADKLTGDDRIILKLRPGITGPASLKYKNEEELLASQADPECYNREVIFPDKVRLNRQYIEKFSFAADVMYIFQTIVSSYVDLKR
jgi:lipopolysaccharide/colanic/teichoic acid biosynthesis glycosyltransferase